MKAKKIKVAAAVPFESVLDKHLKGANQREITAYLNACLGDADDEGLESFFNALENIARAKGVAKLAERVKKTRDTFYKTFANRNPTLKTFRDILHSLDMGFSVNPLGKD